MTFPYIEVIVVTSVVFANTFGILVIFPFVAFMVHDFFPEMGKEDIGFYVGILASSFHLGSLSGSAMWGSLSDTWGRRPVMLFGLFGTFLSILMFGFSLSFWWAVFARFLWGFLNGNLGVAKAYLSEILSDEDMAAGFAIFGFMSGVGRLIAPLAGSYLIYPVESYPNVFGSFDLLRKFPYALPCLLGALVCSLGFIFAFFYLRDDPVNAGIVEKFEKKLLAASQSHESTKLSLLGHGEEDENSSSERASRPVPPHPVFGHLLTRIQSMSSGAMHVARVSWALLQQPPVWITTLTYGLYCLISIVAAEIFPLWTMTDYEHGGFDFTPEDIGFITLCAAPLQMIVQSTMFSYLVSLYGYKRLFQLTNYLVIVTMLAMPFLGLLGTPPLTMTHTEPFTSTNLSSSLVDHSSQALRRSIHDSGDRLGLNSSVDFSSLSTLATRSNTSYLNQTDVVLETTEEVPGEKTMLLWVLMIVINTVNQCSQVVSFTAINVLINNSCFSFYRGAVNGIGQSLASLGRMIGPPLFGIIFVWSENNDLGWPFNYHFTWLLLCAMTVVTMVWTEKLPASIDKKMEDPIEEGVVCRNEEKGRDMAEYEKNDVDLIDYGDEGEIVLIEEGGLSRANLKKT